jgi:hypothetical protein
MSHLDEERLVAACYGDGDPEDMAHLRDCAECAAAAARLRALLDAVDAGPVPERGEDYGAAVWERLQAPLAFERRRQRRAAIRRQVFTWGAVAASLALAFLAGREFPRRTAPAVAEGISPDARERILLMAVGDHLERSQVLLVEISNAGAGDALDVAAAQESAESLVTANRLYRASATRAGDAGVASVLEELERVLVEVAHQPPGTSGKELEHLRRRIEERGILFKVRVIESQVREREKEGRKAPTV